jgi:hypothetical protein
MTMTAATLVGPSIATRTATLPHDRVGWMVLTPAVVSFVYSAMLAFKPTRIFAIQMADENYPVELLTFGLLLAGGIYGLRLAVRARGAGLAAWATVFYLTFSVFLLLTAMEEISWGQWFVHFRTPESIARINTQQEFTLHNLKGIGGKTVWLRMAFGIGGLVGIALVFLPRGLGAAFRAVAVPPKLSVWFVLIAAFSLGDLVTDFIGTGSPVAALFEVMSEVVELQIAAVACLYLWLKSKELLGTSSTA